MIWELTKSLVSGAEKVHRPEPTASADQFLLQAKKENEAK